MTNTLAAIAREAAGHFAAGRFEAAAAAVQKGKPLQVDLLKASRPTLAAMEATADLDEVYGRMLSPTIRSAGREIRFGRRT